MAQANDLLRVCFPRRASRAIVACLLAFAPLAHAETYTTKHGWEIWSCGSYTFTIRLGDGRQVWLRGISGTMSASPQPVAMALPASDRVLRQSLTAIYSPYAPATGSRQLGTPGVPTNSDVSSHLYTGNIKQIGFVPVNETVAQSFDPPVGIPGGIVQVTIVTEKYGLATEAPEQCLDTEGQLVFTFE